MKTKLSAFLIIILSMFTLSLCGCNRVIYGLSDGTYSAEDVQIRFDIADKTKSKYGTFYYTAGEVQSIQGPIEIDNGYVIGTAESDGAKYTFEIKDNDTIVFVLKKSSALYTANGITTIEDGTEFFYSDERS